MGGLVRIIITPRPRTALSTSNPPTIAHGPGRSPSASMTQSGFKTGSSNGMSVASSALTCLIAVA